MCEKLTPATAVSLAILPLTEVLSTQIALPSKPNLKQTLLPFRNSMQTVNSWTIGAVFS